MNKRSCESTAKGDVNMAEIKEAMPAPQPEALDMPDDEVLYELAFSRTLPRFALVNFCLLAYNLLPFYPLDGGRLLRAVLRTLLPLRAAVWAERGVCLLCGALLLACAGYLTLCWHAGPWPLLVCLLLGLRCCRNEEI